MLVTILDRIPVGFIVDVARSNHSLYRGRKHGAKVYMCSSSMAIYTCGANETLIKMKEIFDVCKKNFFVLCIRYLARK